MILNREISWCSLIMVHSHFKVQIFDLSSYEKELSCVVMDNSAYVQERRSTHHNYKESPMSGSLAKHCGDRSILSRKTPKINPSVSPWNKSVSSDDIQEPMSSGEHWTPTQSRCVSYRMQSDYSTKDECCHG